MKKKDTEDLGIFNILLIGENPHSISIADNIHSKFNGDGVSNKCRFNIVDDIEKDIPSKSWFNEFIFDLTGVSNFNNIVVSKGFYTWLMGNPPKMEMLYMKMLLQAMNFVIVNVDGNSYDEDRIFDSDIPQMRFDTNKDFIEDLLGWVDSQLEKISPKMANIRLIRSLSGRNLPYLGDVFGCLSGNKYRNIIKSDKMRFDVPILYDEFIKLTKGVDEKDIDKSIFTRTSSALSVFLK